ncbi:DUF1540 domain-containing protein [Bacillus sp. 1P06AnD]|uniref:DUF1540 domain-containing protein n=1 Tax=Bacillus sp. 1P06AnD TaxID=3132208 RepID=UPI0039A21E43
MAKDVKCSANTCFYWKHGNQCSAKKIMVEVYSSEERARTSSQTGCQTFRPKDEL